MQKAFFIQFCSMQKAFFAQFCSMQKAFLCAKVQKIRKYGKKSYNYSRYFSKYPMCLTPSPIRRWCVYRY